MNHGYDLREKGIEERRAVMVNRGLEVEYGREEKDGAHVDEITGDGRREWDKGVEKDQRWLTICGER